MFGNIAVPASARAAFNTTLPNVTTNLQFSYSTLAAPSNIVNLSNGNAINGSANFTVVPMSFNLFGLSFSSTTLAGGLTPAGLVSSGALF